MAMSLSKRRDPLNDVMPYELLRVAHSLIESGQNERYWAQVPVPKRPVGQVRFEVMRQIATFVVPIVGLLAAWTGYGVMGVLLGLPVAWLMGFLLDMQLGRAIDRKLLRDKKIDVGRYRAVKWLSEQMGIRAEEVTLDVIRKMDKDFIIVQRIIDEKLAKMHAESTPRAATTASVRRRFGNSSETAFGNHTSGADAHHAGNVDSGQVDYAPAHNPSELNITHDASEDYMPYEDYGTTINPASNLPMIQGTCIDIHGNPFGHENTHF